MMSSKKLLRLLAMLFAFAMVAAACGSDSPVGDAVDAAGDAAASAGDAAGDVAEEAVEAVTGDDDEEAMAEDDEAMAEEAAKAAEEAAAQAAADAEAAAAAAEPFEVSYGIAEPVSIDSVNVQESEGFEVARLLYDGLTDLAPDLSAVPAVAESWESPDNTVWTFTLRDDVTFHNGEPVTAQSFVNSFNRVANPREPL